MARKSQHRQRSEPRQAKRHQDANLSVSQSSATVYNQINNNEEVTQKAKEMEELVPIFYFPFTGTYVCELDLSDHSSTAHPESHIGYGPATTENMPCTAEQHRDLDYENQNQASYLPIVRPWEREFTNKQLSHTESFQSPLTIWKNQEQVEEPFNGIGEVVFRPLDRIQDEIYHEEAQRGNGKKRGEL